MEKATNIFSTQARVEQLRKCCETISDNAEEIMKGFDLRGETNITIHFGINEYPVIKIEQEVISKKMLEAKY